MTDVEKWLEQHPRYKRFARNRELIERLMRVEKGEKAETRRYVKQYAFTKIADITTRDVKKRVEIHGVVAEVQRRKYEGCAVCRKKTCDVHDGATKEYTVLSLLVGDDTENIWCSKINGDINVVEGLEVKVRGITRVYRGSLEILIDELEIIEESKVQQFFDVLRKAGKLSEKVAKAYAKNLGIEWENVESELKVEGGYVCLKS